MEALANLMVLTFVVGITLDGLRVKQAGGASVMQNNKNACFRVQMYVCYVWFGRVV